MEPPLVLRAALQWKGLAEAGVFDVLDIGASKSFAWSYLILINMTILWRGQFDKKFRHDTLYWNVDYCLVAPKFSASDRQWPRSHSTYPREKGGEPVNPQHLLGYFVVRSMCITPLSICLPYNRPPDSSLQSMYVSSSWWSQTVGR